MRLWALLPFLLVTPSTARAQSVSVTARSIFHAYQIQLFPGQQDSPERKLDRFYQTLDAGAWFLGPDGDISTVLSFRYDTDFGTSAVDNTGDIRGLSSVGDVDLLYLYVQWDNLIDRHLDLRFGRQVQIDDLDWYSFDGLKATVHLLPHGEDLLDVEIYLGLPVRFDQLFSSEPFINDGVMVDDAPGYFGGLTAGGNASFRMFGLALAAAFRQELIFRKDDLDVFAMQPEAAARSAGKFAMQESLLGFSAGYTVKPIGLDFYGHLTWNLLVGDLNQARAGIGFTPWAFLHFGAEYLRSRPRFLGDSIWNFFNIFAYDKGRFEASMKFLEYFELSLGYYLQEFRGSDIDGTTAFQGSSFNHGPSGGLTFRWQRIAAGFYAEGSSNLNSDYGYGGNYRYGQVFADGEFLDGLLGGTVRFSFTTFQNDWSEQIDDGIVDPAHNSFALDVGARTNIYDWVQLRINFVKNFSSDLEGSYRVYSELALHY